MLKPTGFEVLLAATGNLLFGANSTITITTPLPTDLNGDKFAIDASLTRAEMVALAKGTDNTGMAWRYALRELNSFVISDVSYAAHNTDGSLDLYNKDSNPGGLTDEYLADRAAMLAWKECRQEVAFSLHRQLRTANSIAVCAYLIRARRRKCHKTIGKKPCNALRVKRETMPIHSHAC